MNEQERRVIEVGYNLSQAYIRAKRDNEKDVLLSIIATIYGFNGIAKQIIPDFPYSEIGKDLFRIGLWWHKQLLTGNIRRFEEMGVGKSFIESDFDVEEL